MIGMKTHTELNCIGDSLKHRIIYWAVLLLMQIACFVILHATSYMFYGSFIGQIERDLSWGFFIQYVFYFYLATTMIVGLIGLLISKRAVLFCLIIELLVLSFISLNQFAYRPNKSLLLLFTVAIGIFLPFVILETGIRMINRWRL